MNPLLKLSLPLLAVVALGACATPAAAPGTSAATVAAQDQGLIVATTRLASKAAGQRQVLQVSPPLKASDLALLRITLEKQEGESWVDKGHLDFTEVSNSHTAVFRNLRVGASYRLQASVYTAIDVNGEPLVAAEAQSEPQVVTVTSDEPTTVETLSIALNDVTFEFAENGLVEIQDATWVYDAVEALTLGGL